MDNSDKIEILIAKFLAGEASPEEAIQLEDWKNESSQNLQQFNQSVKLFNLATQSSNQLNINKEQAWAIIENDAIKKSKVIQLRPHSKIAIGIAASVLIILSSYFIIQKNFLSNQNNLITVAAVDAKKEINLTDQTNIQIAKGSSIIYDQNYGKSNRNVKLLGNAYFTVKHNDTLPFIVNLGHVFVKDLGTKFNITLSADTDSIHIRVDEGVVLLFDSASKSIEIKAGERAIYIKSSRQIIKPASANETTLNFDKTPLINAFNEIEEKFSCKIIVENPAINSCTISAKFKDEDVSTILAIITETLGLTVVLQNENYIIKGNACN